MKLISYLVVVLVICILGSVGADVPNFDNNGLGDFKRQDVIRESNGKFLSFEKFKSYNVSKKSLLIETSDFDVLVDIVLASNYKENVRVGRVMVAEFFGGVVFDDVLFYDVKDNYSLVERDYDLRYFVELKNSSCYDVEKFNNNTNVSLGFYEVCDMVGSFDWIVFDSYDDLPKKDVRVGLFVDTILGEEIEWVPVIEGFEVREWASYLVTDLIAYWKLDETSGAVAEDITGNEHNGTVSYGAGGWEETGKINTALLMDTGYISLGESHFSSSTFSDNGLTITMWIKTVAAQDYFFDFEGGWTSYSNSDGYVSLKIDGEGANHWSTTSINDGNWHFLAFTADPSGNCNISIDGGVSENSFTEGWYNIDLLSREQTISGYWSLAGGNGTRDEIGLWNTVLNQSAITDLYNSGDGLAYPFEEAEENCWTETAGKIVIPPTCKYYTNVLEVFIHG